MSAFQLFLKILIRVDPWLKVFLLS